MINYKRSTWTFESAPLDLDEGPLIGTWVDVCIGIITAEPPAAGYWRLTGSAGMRRITWPVGAA